MGFDTLDVKRPVQRIRPAFIVSGPADRQKDRRGVRLLLFILPKDRFDAKLALLLDEAADVVAENLAQDFVDHREIG